MLAWSWLNYTFIILFISVKSVMIALSVSLSFFFLILIIWVFSVCLFCLSVSLVLSWWDCQFCIFLRAKFWHYLFSLIFFYLLISFLYVLIFMKHNFCFFACLFNCSCWKLDLEIIYVATLNIRFYPSPKVCYFCCLS